MGSCTVCESENTDYLCPIINDNICTNCCSDFQICKLEKWDTYLEKESEISVLSENCLQCNGLTRDEDYIFKVDGNYQIFMFEYDGQFVFSYSPGEILNKKKLAYLNSLAEKDTSVKYNMAEVYLELNDLESSINLLKQIEVQSEYSEIPLLIARIFKKTQDLNMALSYYNKALQIDSKNALINRELGDLYQLLGNYHSSIHFYNESLNNFGLNEEGELNDFFNDENYLGLAVSYSKLEDYQKTIEYSRKYLSRRNSWGGLQKQVDEYRNNISKYINIEFDIYTYSTIYYLMSISYLELNDLQSAEKYINRTLELDESNITYAKLSGIIIGRKLGEGELNKYKEEVFQLKAIAENSVSNITSFKDYTPEKQVVLYTRNDKETVRFFLVKQIFKALRATLNFSNIITPSIDTPADEDKYTDFIKTQMTWLKELFGWTFETQNRGGYTRNFFGIRGGIGERDFVIKSQEDKDLLIGEALILKSLDTAVVNTHTQKIFGYDIQSSNFYLVIIYGFSKTPNELWQKYKELITSRTEGNFAVVKSGEIEELIPEIDKQALRTFYTTHTTDQEQIESNVIHVYLDIYNEMKRNIAATARNK